MKLDRAFGFSSRARRGHEIQAADETTPTLPCSNTNVHHNGSDVGLG